MKRILSIALLSVASFVSGCSTPTSSVEASSAALTETEAAYVGSYRAGTDSADEIQTLTLVNDNTFSGLIAASLVGVEAACPWEPCTAETNGTWAVADNGERKKLTLTIPAKEEGASETTIAYEVAEGPGELLKLTRGATTIALTKWLSCPQVEVDTTLVCEGEVISTYDANGCFAGTSCKIVEPPPPPPVCPQVELPANAVCAGTWEARYDANGCFVENVCIPTPPPPPVP